MPGRPGRAPVQYGQAAPKPPPEIPLQPEDMSPFQRRAYRAGLTRGVKMGGRQGEYARKRLDRLDALREPE